VPLRDVVGHRHLLELLGAAAVRGSLPPSLIFVGPAGIGKRTAALALAQAVNCPTPRDSDACGVCASCTRIARLVHADVLIIEPGESGSIKVDQIRDAVERTGYRPFEGRKRVVIVDDADAMIVEAQNALLKTLEEPPAGSMFVLVTGRLDMLLPTVRSRCQQLRFGQLHPDEVASVLVNAHGYSAPEAHAAAGSAAGSVGRALDDEADTLSDARDAAARLLQAVAATADPRRRLDGAKVLAGTGDRDDVRRRLRALASLLRDLGAIGAQADARHLVNADLAPSLGRLAASFDGGRTTRAFAAVDRALEAIDRNASPKIVADWLAFQL
jgi:DNA polymerase-3 subunit delta'